MLNQEYNAGTKSKPIKMIHALGTCPKRLTSRVNIFQLWRTQASLLRDFSLVKLDKPQSDFADELLLKEIYWAMRLFAK